jgi:diadenosine tetraphosphatase ApaH/serine/threonine PP2A family protein phosphatase
MNPHSRDTLGEPRRVAVLSDVHGNLPALRAVLADVDGSDAEAIWCLGDLVGYGAQPDECVALARERCDLCLVGNHDLVVLGRIEIGVFSPHAALAAEWTRRRVGRETLDFLAGLSPSDTSHSVGLFHASPRDPVWEYVLTSEQAEGCLAAMDHRVGIVGHSHVALSFSQPADGRVEGRLAPAGTELDLAEGRWLVNPGGAGQPRDGDPRAAWLLLDLEARRASWRRVAYPVEEAADAIRAAGLPVALGDRLYYGQ